MSNEEVATREWIEDDEVKQLLEERMDRIDYLIFRELNKDGRMPDTELAERIGIARTTVRRRRKNLQKANVLDIPALLIFQESGFSYADVHVSYASDVSQADVVAFVESLLDEPLVYEMAECVGEYDLLLRVWHASLGNVKSYIRESLHQRPVVGSYTIVPITQSYKMWFQDFYSDDD